jgi:hypothetical protein
VTETNVFQLCQPRTFSDPLTDVLRNGARALLAQTVEAESAMRHCRSCLSVAQRLEGTRVLACLCDKR